MPEGSVRLPALELDEIRVLDGPNLYFTRPAVKLALRGRATAPDALKAALAAFQRHLAPSVGEGLEWWVESTEEGLIIAFPWRRRGTATALAEQLGRLLAVGFEPGSAAAAEVAAAVGAAEPGPEPPAIDPQVPVVQVTGTNGKTTTVRLLAHIARTAGRAVAYTTTDGVFFNEGLVLAGDYTGVAGAATALAQPGVELAVLETARGGILLRGIGVTRNDVAVVTNVSADHLGQYGVNTLEQLARVKGVITRITRSEGWDVLNADDPLVSGMRSAVSGQPWLFAAEPGSPALRAHLAAGGQAAAVDDGWLTALGTARRRLARLEEVPVTLFGVSRQHVENALAAASAAIAVGLPEVAVAEGLRTFVPGVANNPVRANLLELAGTLIVLDYAHNEAGMRGLVDLCRRLRPPGGRIVIGIGTAGDRPDASLRAFARAAVGGSDEVALVEKREYLRGRPPDDLIQLLRQGVMAAGGREPRTFPDEVAALKGLLDGSHPGDVVALTVHSQRQQVLDDLRRRQAQPVGPAQLRRLVAAAEKT